MDQEDQGREFGEKVEKTALESEPDGFKDFKRTLADLTGRNPRNSKGKAPVQYQRDEDSRASDHDYQRESPLMQETSEPVWVNPQFSNSPRDPVLLPSSGDDTYRFCHETRGFAVLVINSEFDSESRRKNADDDERYMSKMFKELDFDVRVLKNLSAAELLEKMEEIRDSISVESDCFACVISSHGMEGQVRTSIPGVREPFIRTEHFTYARDGAVSTNMLLELFNDRNCRSLKGKPKMFFIQACRGRLDVQRSDQVDMGVEVVLVETTATTSAGSPARFFTRGDMAPTSSVNTCDMAPTSSSNTCDIAPTSSSNTGDLAPKSADNTEDVVPTNFTTTGDVVGNYDDYSGRRRDDFRKNFTAATLDPTYTSRYKVNVEAQEPARTSTYKFKPTEFEPEPVEVFQIPCYNDYLVMFSSAAGTLAWSDSDKGGWLMYCLYQVFHDVTYTYDDLLTTLTRVSGKMALDMESNCPSIPHQDKAKSAACVYHRLSKDIYLQPMEIKKERKR